MESKKITDYEVAKKLCNLYDSAKDRRIPFDLSVKRVRQLLQQENCYFTGVPFDNVENIRSVDRVDADLGYIDSNVVACTERFNRKKANLTAQDAILLYKGVVKLQAKQSKTTNKNAII